MVKLTFVANGDLRVGCAGENGMSMGEQIRQLTGGLSLAYGSQLDLEFFDLDQGENIGHELVNECFERNYSLPALFINRQLKFEGVIPLMALKSVLDELGLQPAIFGEPE